MGVIRWQHRGHPSPVDLLDLNTLRQKSKPELKTWPSQLLETLIGIRTGDLNGIESLQYSL